MTIRRGARIAAMLILLSAPFAMEAGLADDFPNWLSGKADLNVVEGQSKFYEWVFEQADRQTGGMAARDALARNRLINLANKLAVNYIETDLTEFSVELRYLVLDTEQPMHFSFFITRDMLEELLSRQDQRSNSCRIDNDSLL